MAIQLSCDVCTEIIKSPSQANSCEWCAKHICNLHSYIDEYSRAACLRCAKEKHLPVRPAMRDSAKGLEKAHNFRE